MVGEGGGDIGSRQIHKFTWLVLCIVRDITHGISEVKELTWVVLDGLNARVF